MRRGRLLNKQEKIAFKLSLDTIVDALQIIEVETKDKMEVENNSRNVKTLDKVRSKIKDCKNDLEYCDNTLQKMN